MIIFLRCVLIISSILIFHCRIYPYTPEKESNVPPTSKKDEPSFKAERHAPAFPHEKSTLRHIFRNEKGHFMYDTPENRDFILSAASSPECRVGTTKQSVEIYLKLMPDGSQAWAFVKNGIITNGGINRLPLKWVANSSLPLGGEFVSLKYNKYPPNSADFINRLKFNNLIGTYALYHPKSSLAERKITLGPVKGVENQTGVILNMFDDPSQVNGGEHAFFFPTPEGLLLEEYEIQQILSELARGIFFYEAVPFFSLHFNQDLVQYPIIHPAYQNTLVGHIISMLDYHMKGFINGCYFTEDFVQEWDQQNYLNEHLLKSNCLDLKDYCSKQLGVPYFTFKELFEQVRAELPKAPAANFDIYQHSFRLIAKQNKIRRSKNLYILDGGFDVLYSLIPLHDSPPDSFQQHLEEQVCARMCQQIKEIMPRLPLYKKYFQALSLINFFTYHFTTLKAAQQVITLTPHLSFRNPRVCPSSFPPFPIESSFSNRLEIDLLSLLETLPPLQNQTVQKFIRGFQNNTVAENQAIESLSKGLSLFASSKLPADHPALRSFEWKKKAAYLLKSSKSIDQALTQKMDATLVVLGIKRAGEPLTGKMISQLMAKIDQSIQKTSSLIEEINQEIKIKQQKHLPYQDLQAELQDMQRSKESFKHDKKMWLLWSQGSLIPSLGKTLIALELSNNDLLIYSERHRGSPLVVGGFGIGMGDKLAEHDPLGDTLLARYESPLSQTPYGKIFHIPGNQKGEISGVLFKLPFERFSTTNEEEKRLSLGYYSFPYYSKNPLTNEQVQIFHAIATQDVELFKTVAPLIQDWNFYDLLGVNVLHYAASESNPFFLNYLLTQKVNLETKDPQGYTLLHYAAQYSSLPCLQPLLMKIPHLLDCPSKNGETPLYVAVQSNQLATLKHLLKMGGNPNLKTPLGMNALMCAIFQGHEEAALELLNSSQIDLEHCLEDRSTVFHLAVEAQMERVVDRLCEMGCNACRTRYDGFTPLHLAAEQGWTPGVRLILQKCSYIDINTLTKTGKTAFQLASDRKHLEVIYLLQQAADRQH